MKKFIALMVWGLVIFTPAAVGENDGARSLDANPQIYRLPQNDGGDGIIELRANNIQVQAEWSINPDAPFDVDNGKLHYIGGDGVLLPPATVTVTVTVEDNFKLLNPSYENLTAVAVITIEFLPSQSTIYVMGGYDGTVYYEDVWSSSDDGQSWSVESAPSWSGREKFQAVVHNGTIYVLGGGGNNGRLNDVWSSPDGKTWEFLGNADWTARDSHQAVVHNGVIYVLGGNGDNNQNDVWSSVDGITWSAVQPNADWRRRRGHQVVSHNGRMYMLGGRAEVFFGRDVWSSADGVDWVQETETGEAEWGLRLDFQAVSHNGKIYVLGGVWSSGGMNDVWSSVDGKEWTRETPDAGAQWGGRSAFQAFSHNGLLYVLGGDRSGGINALDDVWSSRDGRNWNPVKGNAEWPARYGLQTVILP